MPEQSFIYLASQSPRRAQLLTQLGLPHRLLLANTGIPCSSETDPAHAADLPEDAEALEAVRPAEAAAAYVLRVTADKLDAAVQRLRRRGLAPAPILCADTTVALGRSILGKPLDGADAARMLARLAGRSHQVLTAVAVQHGGQRRLVLSRSSVTFAALTAAQIQAYVASGEPLGKAGSYAVQGRAAAFIAHISGSYSGIMGLPMFETAELLRSVGVKV